MIDEELVIEKIVAAVKDAGQIILNAKRDASYIEEKEGHANFVTKYDKEVQEKLFASLMEILPNAVFVGEESENAVSFEKGLAYIVDPIDGTTNFIKDLHMSAISVGVVKDLKPYLGVIYNPYLDEVYTAVKGKGAYLNGKAIHVSEKNLEDGIVIFGTSPYYEELKKKSFEMAYDYSKKCLDVRRTGSAAIDLCNIAAGRAELFFELKLSPWDYAAGAVLVTEAGGFISTVDGDEISFDRGCSVLASNMNQFE